MDCACQGPLKREQSRSKELVFLLRAKGADRDFEAVLPKLSTHLGGDWSGQLPNTATDVHFCPSHTGWNKNRSMVERLVDHDNDHLIIKEKLCTQAKQSEEFAQYFPLAPFWKADPQYTILIASEHKCKSSRLSLFLLLSHNISS